jgi:hypothetical protein
MNQPISLPDDININRSIDHRPQPGAQTEMLQPTAPRAY